MKKYSIELTEEQLLVLSDLVFRINNSKILSNFFEDQAEERILWILENILEKNTPNIFSKNYLDALRDARKKIRDSR